MWLEFVFAFVFSFVCLSVLKSRTTAMFISFVLFFAIHIFFSINNQGEGNINHTARAIMNEIGGALGVYIIPYALAVIIKITFPEKKTTVQQVLAPQLKSLSPTPEILHILNSEDETLINSFQSYNIKTDSWELPLFLHQEFQNRNITPSKDVNQKLDEYAIWHGYSSFEQMRNEYSLA